MDNQNTEQNQMNSEVEITSIKKNKVHPNEKPKIDRRKYKTEEQRQARAQEKREYYKQYYKEHKDQVNKKNNECWKKRRAMLIKMANDPRVQAFWEQLQKEDELKQQQQQQQHQQQ